VDYSIPFSLKEVSVAGLLKEDVPRPSLYYDAIPLEFFLRHDKMLHSRIALINWLILVTFNCYSTFLCGHFYFA